MEKKTNLFSIIISINTVSEVTRQKSKFKIFWQVLFISFSYVGGLEEEQDYSYHAEEGLCEFDSTKTAGTVREVFNITETDEDQLTIALAYFNPVSVAFEVVDGFRFYKEGVYQSGS